MKKIIIVIFVFLLVIGNMYTQQLGTQTPFQHTINAIPAIPIPLIGENIKFEFGGDNWIANLNEENFIAGSYKIEESAAGHVLTLSLTHVWSKLVDEVIYLSERAEIPLGSAENPLRKAARSARVAKWLPHKGSAIILEYHEGPPINISFLKMEKQEDNTQTRERTAKIRYPSHPLNCCHNIIGRR